MSPSQEILNSIEDRLRQLAQEIAELQSARSKLQNEGSARAKPARGRPRKTASRSGRSRPAAKIAPVMEISEEEWLERRAAELAAQSREAAAA